LRHLQGRGKGFNPPLGRRPDTRRGCLDLVLGVEHHARFGAFDVNRPAVLAAPPLVGNEGICLLIAAAKQFQVLERLLQSIQLFS
jgi:hypothetical protein